MVSGTPASARSCHYVLLKLLRERIPLEATGNEPVYGFGDYTYGFWTAVHLYFLKL